ncbi:MAG: hypothetical protein CTY39_09660 [Hyphomicrobium sp.]|nr:MAG: hypothetical protein CTY39_09660 [Hyphomicrobium sp.]
MTAVLEVHTVRSDVPICTTPVSDLQLGRAMAAQARPENDAIRICSFWVHALSRATILRHAIKADKSEAHSLLS